MSVLRLFGAVAALSSFGTLSAPALSQTLSGSPIGNLIASGISGDGTVIVGTTLGSTSSGFRWTRGGGVELLAPPGGTRASCFGVNYNGSVAVGEGQIADGSYHACAWPGGVLESPSSESRAVAVNDDGSIVVGSATLFIEATHAIVWNSGAALDLGVLPDGSYSVASAISGGSNVIAGSGDASSSGAHAFRAIGGGALEVLPVPSGAIPAAVSDDGSVIVGTCELTHAGEVGTAFRWSAETGYQNLGALPGGDASAALDVSGDGTMTVGRSGSPFGAGIACFWTSALGPVNLRDYLQALGADLDGWWLAEAVGISSDGKTIAGNGSLYGQQRAWVVTLECCPQHADLQNRHWNEHACEPNDLACRDPARHNHCYQYAVNRPLGWTRNPGPDSCYDVINPTSMRKAAEFDGLVPTTSSESCEDGCLVALWVKPGPPVRGGGDYHWWRKNDDGTWSEKISNDPAQLVANPEDVLSERGGYRFVQYYCVPCGFQYPDTEPGQPVELSPGQVRIRANATSGLANPYFDTDDPELLSLLRAALVAGEPQPATSAPRQLGFAGFTVEAGTEVADLPPFLEFKGGQAVYLTENGHIAREDVLGVAGQLDALGTSEHGWGCLLHRVCAADQDCDGGVTVPDIFAFLSAWFAREPGADFDADGTIAVPDIFEFLSAWFAGC